MANTGATTEANSEDLSRYEHTGLEPPLRDHRRTAAVTSATAREEALTVKQFPASNVAKALALEQIEADHTKKPIALDPRRHRDLSVKDVVSAIAKHLREPAHKLTGTSGATTRPNGTQTLPLTRSVDPIAQDNGAWEPTAAVLELQSGTEIGAETPAIIALESDSEDEISDTSFEAASTDVEKETVPDFKTVGASTHRPGQPYSFAPVQLQRKHITGFPAVRATAIIGSHVLETMVDSGASQSFMNRDIVTRLGLEHRVRHVSSIRLMNADGCTSRLSEGLIRGVTLLLGDLQITMDLHVTSGDRYDLLLGSDFLVFIGAKMDNDAKVLRYSLGQSIGEIHVNFRGWGRESCYLNAEMNLVHPGEPPPGPSEPNMPQCVIYGVNSDSKDTAEEGNQEMMHPGCKDDDKCTEPVLPRSLQKPYNKQRHQLYAWEGVPSRCLNTVTKLDTKHLTRMGPLLDVRGPKGNIVPFYKKIPPRVTRWDGKELKRVLPASNANNHRTFRPP